MEAVKLVVRYLERSPGEPVVGDHDTYFTGGKKVQVKPALPIRPLQQQSVAKTKKLVDFEDRKLLQYRSTAGQVV